MAEFPIAFVIAWAFELTPEGLKRTEPRRLIRAFKTRRLKAVEFREGAVVPFGAQAQELPLGSVSVPVIAQDSLEREFDSTTPSFPSKVAALSWRPLAGRAKTALSDEFFLP